MNRTTKLALSALAGALVLFPTAREHVTTATAPLVRAASAEVAFATGASNSAPSVSTDTASAARPASKSGTVSPRPAAARPASVPGKLGTKTGASHYRFTATGSNGQPARWNPCAPIRIMINPAGAPSGAVADLREAVTRVAAATGLRLTIIGTTKAKSVTEWGYHQRTGYDGWAPVLVSWGHPGGALNEGASATTEPTWVENADGQAVFVSGQLRINVEHDDYYTAGFGSEVSRVALYMHELGHVVGLDHVDDDRQLMYPSMGGAADFGAGDLTGLRKAGQGGCVTVPPASWQ